MNINQLVGNNNIFNGVKNISGTNETGSQENGGLSFISTLKQQLDGVNDKQLEAENETEAFIKGDDIDIHQVMITSEEAKMSLEMAVQVRNKLVEAYQELNRMQL